MGIIRLLISITVFTIAAIVILDNLGANVTGLVAGLGIGGIAIGLAAQGIFSDLFAALSILFDKPFRVGDTITYQGKEGPVTGTVKKIGLKSTRILSLAGELRIIGNTQLLAQEVTNFTGRQMFRFRADRRRRLPDRPGGAGRDPQADGGRGRAGRAPLRARRVHAPSARARSISTSCSKSIAATRSKPTPAQDDRARPAARRSRSAASSSPIRPRPPSPPRPTGRW